MAMERHKYDATARAVYEQQMHLHYGYDYMETDHQALRDKCPGGEAQPDVVNTPWYDEDYPADRPGHGMPRSFPELEDGQRRGNDVY